MFAPIAKTDGKHRITNIRAEGIPYESKTSAFGIIRQRRKTRYVTYVHDPAKDTANLAKHGVKPDTEGKIMLRTSFLNGSAQTSSQTVGNLCNMFARDDERR